jgi:Zn-finger nucleic acid-binding protein
MRCPECGGWIDCRELSQLIQHAQPLPHEVATTSAAPLVPADEEAVMADDPSKRGPQDRSRISLSEDYEVRYWSQKFGVTPEVLRMAVEKVGNSAEAVEKEIDKSGA